MALPYPVLTSQTSEFLAARQSGNVPGTVRT
jgi:hypothetical protein